MLETSNVPPAQVSSGEVAAVAVQLLVTGSFLSIRLLRASTAKRTARIRPHWQPVGPPTAKGGQGLAALVGFCQALCPGAAAWFTVATSGLNWSAIPSAGAVVSTPTPYCARKATIPSTSCWGWVAPAAVGEPRSWAIVSVSAIVSTGLISANANCTTERAEERPA